MSALFHFSTRREIGCEQIGLGDVVYTDHIEIGMVDYSADCLESA